MKVPKYEKRVAPQTPGVETPQVARIAPAGADVAAANVNMGRAVQGLANQFAGFAEGLAKDAADKRIMERDTAITLETQDLLKNDKLDEKTGRLTGLLLREGDGAAGALKEFDEKWNAIAERHINAASGPYEREQIAARLKSMRLTARENVINHEVAQKKVSDGRAYTANFNAIISKAEMSTDPIRDLPDQLKEADLAATKYLLMQGMTRGSESFREAHGKAMLEVVKAPVSKLLKTDTDKAQSILMATSTWMTPGQRLDLQKAINGASVDMAENRVWAAIENKTRLDGNIDTSPIYKIAESLKTADGEPATPEQKQSFIKSLESRASGMDRHRAEVKKANDYDFLSKVYAEYQSPSKDKQKAISIAKQVALKSDHADLGAKLDIIDRIWGGDTGDLKMKNEMAEFELRDALERVDTLYPKGTMGVIEGQGSSEQDLNGFLRTNMRRNAFGKDAQAIKEMADRLLDGRKVVPGFFNKVTFGLIPTTNIEGNATIKADLESRGMARKVEEISRKDAELKREFSPTQIEWAAKKLGGMAVTPDNIRAVLLSVKRGEHGKEAVELLARLGEKK